MIDSLILASAMACLPGCFSTDDPQVEARVIAADGVKGITDSSYNALFSGGDAVKGVAELIAKGSVKINGTAVPPASGDKLDINGGLASALDVTVLDVAMAETVTRGSSATTLTTVGKGDNSTNKPSPASVSFPNTQVEGNPQGQDVVLYWLDTSGWHLKRATPLAATAQVVVTVSNGTNSYAGNLNGASMVDSRLTLQYSEPWNRPSQPFQAMAWLGENDVRLTQWQNVPGITIGLSRGAQARPDLTAAIAKARAALTAVQVSAAGDGTDMALGQPWVTQAYQTIFTQAVTDAQAVLDDTAATAAQCEGALYRLAQAYGGRTGERNSWLENTYFGRGSDYGRAAAFDTGYNGTGFWTFAQSHVGTATAANAPTSRAP